MGRVYGAVCDSWVLSGATTDFGPKMRGGGEYPTDAGAGLGVLGVPGVWGVRLLVTRCSGRAVGE